MTLPSEDTEGPVQAAETSPAATGALCSPFPIVRGLPAGTESAGSAAQGEMDMPLKRCPYGNSWYWYFKENMKDLHLPVPDSWGGGSATILGHITALANIAEKMGSKVTIREVLGAGTKTEILSTVGAIYASFYLGAAIGSAAVASGEYMGCGVTLRDAIGLASSRGIHSQQIQWVLTTHPEIVDTEHRLRFTYAAMASAMST